MSIKIVALGDSNTVSTTAYGATATGQWCYLLRNSLAAAFPSQTYTLQNSGVSGQNAQYFLSNVAATCLNHDPHIVVMMLGTNDTYGDGGVYNADANAALAAFEANMGGLIEAILAHTNADGSVPRIVLLQPPIAMDAIYGTRDGYTGFISNPYTVGNPYIYGRPRSRLILLKDAVDEIGATYGCPVAPTWDNLDALGWGQTTNVSNANVFDGVHITASAHTLVGGYAYAAMLQVLDSTGSPLLHATADTDSINLSYPGTPPFLIERRVV